jgi:proteic killer suppression protein
MIKSFADKRTAAIFAGYVVRGLPVQIQKRARTKILAVDAASQLDDLRIPPGNRLEALRGDRKGQHSVRVRDVEIDDYH